MRHLGMNALWVWKISKCIQIFSLLAITLDIILYNILYKLIGMKSYTFFGYFLLGIRTIWVCFNAWEKFSVFKALRIAFVTIVPIICQYFWKNIRDIPSGIWALDGCICWIVSWTYFGVKSLVRLVLISSLIWPINGSRKSLCPLWVGVANTSLKCLVIIVCILSSSRHPHIIL